MTRRVMDDLRGSEIAATNGRIGSIDDVYFDDEHWVVRYLVADTGRWLPGRQVLISPSSVARVESDRVGVALTREQVEGAPDAETARPVSRLYEQAHARYYGYPFYWGGPMLWGAAGTPAAGGPAHQVRRDPQNFPGTEELEREARESHLRSGGEVTGYRIRAADGEIGHVEDFEIDEQSWAITGMVVDTRNWLPGRKVRVAPSAIESVDWSAREVRVRLKRAEIERSPATG